MLKTLGVVAGITTLDDFIESLEVSEPPSLWDIVLTILQQPCSTKKGLEKYCGRLLDSIKPLLEEGGSRMQPRLKASLDGLCRYSCPHFIWHQPSCNRELLENFEEIRNGEDSEAVIEFLSLKVTQAIDSFLVRSIFTIERQLLTLFDTARDQYCRSYHGDGLLRQGGETRLGKLPFIQALHGL